MGIRASLHRLQTRTRAAVEVLRGPERAIADQRLRTSLGLSPFVLSYNPDDLVQRKGLKIYEQMRRDEQIKSCLAVKKAAILGPGWALEPASEMRRDVQLARTLTEDLKQLPRSFRGKLWSILTALDYGFSVTEKVADVRDRRIALTDLKTRAPHDFEFVLDPYGNVTGITQRQNPANLVTLPPEKFIHYRHQDEFGNPYGRSDLYEAYTPWWHKTHWRQWLAIWGERLAVPAVVGKHPPNASAATITQVMDVLKAMQSTTAFTVPQTWELDLLETSRNPRSTFVEVLDHHDLRIARSLLLPDKMGLAGGEVKHGSYALATAQLGIWFTVIDFLREELAETVQEQIIADMVAFENPSAPPPSFRLLPLGEDDVQAIGGLWIQAVSGGTVQPTPRDEQHFRTLVEFPELTDAELAERQEDATLRRERRRSVPVPPSGDVDDDGDADGGGPAGPAPPPDDEARMVALLPSRGIVGAAALQPADTFWRALRPVELRANMVEQRTQIESATERLAGELGELSEAIVTDLRQRVRKAKLARPNASLPAIRTLRLNQRIAGRAHRLMGDGLKATYERARRQAVGEVRRSRRLAAADPLPGLVGPRAERYFGNKAILVTDVLIDDVLRLVQQRLFAAIKQDKTERQIMFELDEVLTPFLPTRNRAGAIVNVPARLEVIARTNIADAVNEGRWAVFSDPEVREAIAAVQYTAILDNRVRDTHRAWDGVTLPVDHEVWFGPPDRRPPNGYNCRCMLVPVIVDDPDVTLTDPADVPIDVPLVDPGFK